ncbi:MAG: AmmeMemoRadiSam system protein B [Elusimicrobiota bacterium]
MIRKASVAGMFYPAIPDTLYKEVDKYLVRSEAELVKAIIVPHAGYVYSGKVAGLTYSQVIIPDTILLVGPNHTGLGAAVSVMDTGKWSIPGKDIEIDEDISAKLLSYSSYAQSDTMAHLNEHSLEVQLPFLYRINPAVKFVPITIGTHDINVIEDVGAAFSKIIEESDKDILMVASSDMSHFISEQEAEKYDRMAIEKIEALDYRGLMEVVERENISMCGAVAAAVVLKACVDLGAGSAELVHYNTSAEASGDTGRVVGYAGMKIK